MSAGLPLMLARGFVERRRHGAPTPGDDVLFFSQHHWENVWRRNQHVAKHLSTRRRILYITPFPVHLLLSRGGGPQDVSGRWVGNGIYSLSVPVFAGENKLPFIRRLNRRYLEAVVDLRIRRTGISPGILWFSHPYAESSASARPALPVVYDVQAGYPAVPSAPVDTGRREVRLLRRADLVLTGTYALYEAKREHADNIHFVPCGVDFDHFHGGAPGGIPPELAALRGSKVLGYFGEVGDRIDWPLLRDIGVRHPDWEIVLIGGVSRVGPEVAGLPNVHFFGKRGYDQLPAYVRGFDVCLIPFKLDALTRFIYPTKLLEYLSAGKPVVSSPIPDVCRFFEGVVGIADDVDTFDAELKRLENGAECVKRGIEMARDASWEKAVAEMESHLEAAIERRNERKGIA